MQVQDAETGQQMWIDTNDKNLRTAFSKTFEQHKRYCAQSFGKSGAGLLSIRTDQDYVKVLQGYFKGR